MDFMARNTLLFCLICQLRVAAKHSAQTSLGAEMLAGNACINWTDFNDSVTIKWLIANCIAITMITEYISRVSNSDIYFPHPINEPMTM